jgi:hypothetical protein
MMGLQPDLNDYFKHLSKGELIFKSFEEALNFVRYPTNYEQKRNITVTETLIVVDEHDVKLVMRKVSDNTHNLFIFFKNSTVFDVWKFWCPSKTQFNFLTKTLPNLINELEGQNNQKRNGGCNGTI